MACGHRDSKMMYTLPLYGKHKEINSLRDFKTEHQQCVNHLSSWKACNYSETWAFGGILKLLAADMGQKKATRSLRDHELERLRSNKIF
jgi:hypothetical protein